MTLDLAADLSILWWLLAGLLILVGIAGTALPALPGVVLVFFGLLFGAAAKLALAFLMLGIFITALIF